jgi:hypothetical protein
MMATLMLRCPKTGLPINPGIETDTDSFDAVLDAQVPIECPHCGEQHRIRVRDGKLNESTRAAVGA